jgi:hypothetical protein
MSTRAVYTFRDQDSQHAVYKHYDGYPTEALGFIENALARAWPLPRFEADEFAAAFVAANKTSSGNVYLTTGPERHGDLAYRYEVTCRDATLRVEVYERLHLALVGSWQSEYRLLFAGTLAAARRWAEQEASRYG